MRETVQPRTWSDGSKWPAGELSPNLLVRRWQYCDRPLGEPALLGLRFLVMGAIIFLGSIRCGPIEPGVRIEAILAHPERYGSVVAHGELTAPSAVIPFPKPGVLRHLVSDHGRDSLAVFIPIAADTFCTGVVRLPGTVYSAKALGVLRVGPILVVTHNARAELSPTR